MYSRSLFTGPDHHEVNRLGTDDTVSTSQKRTRSSLCQWWDPTKFGCPLKHTLEVV
jgi:hypothetical protein